MRKVIITSLGEHPKSPKLPWSLRNSPELFLALFFWFFWPAKQRSGGEREKEHASWRASTSSRLPTRSGEPLGFERGARVRSFTSLVFRISFGLTIQLLTWVQQLRTPLFPHLLSHGEITVSPSKPLTNQGERVSPLFHSARP